MGRGPSRLAVTAVAAPGALAAAACGRSANGARPASGDISPVKGLVRQRHFGMGRVRL
jgi:hypothetical protein